MTETEITTELNKLTEGEINEALFGIDLAGAVSSWIGACHETKEEWIGDVALIIAREGKAADFLTEIWGPE